MIFPKCPWRILLFTLLTLMFGSQSLMAKVNFSEIRKEKIDLNELKISKKKIFLFLKTSIKNKRKGLGAYGRVSFNLCQIPIDGQPLEEYKSQKGREIRFLSNPSCGLTILQKILENDYAYRKESLTKYGNRECLLEIKKIFSPLMEYYTIQYEERTKSCQGCTEQEKKRLEKISSIQAEIGENCLKEKSKVMHFLEDLDQIIESAYQEKSLNNR